MGKAMLIDSSSKKIITWTDDDKVKSCPICGKTSGLLSAFVNGGYGTIAMRMCECGFACTDEHWNSILRREDFNEDWGG